MNHGWIVALAGFGLNLALGIVYAWSIFERQLTEPIVRGGFGWSKFEATLPYSIAIACLAAVMVPAGRLQDSFGPRATATVGGILVGAGLLVSALVSADRRFPAIAGFGVVAGVGIGLAYAAATPAAIKWFAADDRGLITGIVVSGFGLASVYIAPLSRWLLAAMGIRSAFLIMGIGFLIVTVSFAQLLQNPSGLESQNARSPAASRRAGPSPWEVLRDPNFASLYLQFACGSAAGLMIIGHLVEIVALQSQDQIRLGSLAVAVLAVFNAGGRILAGAISDRIGRNLTVVLFFTVQAVNLASFGRYSTIVEFLAGAAIAGCCYGSCASLFAAATADCWGMEGFGLNYGMLFTAWGVGGIVGPLLAGRIADVDGSFRRAYLAAAVMLVVGALLAGLRHAGIPALLMRTSGRPMRAENGDQII